MTFSPESLPRMTPEQFLRYEQQQEIKHELVDGYLYAMTGASDRHEEIALNLAGALNAHLKNRGCRAYKGDLKLRIADDFYYPDVFVRCSDSRGDPYFKTDPLIIAEVLSPATQRYDRGDKRLAYTSLPSLQTYLLLAQDRPEITLYDRAAFDQPIVLKGTSATLQLTAIDFSITLAELYA